jgi:hypothetical protein
LPDHFIDSLWNGVVPELRLSLVFGARKSFRPGKWCSFINLHTSKNALLGGFSLMVGPTKLAAR